MSNKTHSAGGLVINKIGEVLLVQEYGFFWGLPRGHIEANETPLAAAMREVKEETGITSLHFVKKLGSYQRYTFDKDGKENFNELKHITFFLFETDELNLLPQDKNITTATWVPPTEATSFFINQKDIDFYKKCLKNLKAPKSN